MTAEIAVLNKSGVALAADSKVTIGGTGSGKTFDTVNKVFTLSKYHPVGLMVFGNAEFMLYPWETIVKMYRSQKGDKNELYVGDWGKDFVLYLKSFGNVTKDDKKDNLYTCLQSYFIDIRQKSVAEARAKNLKVPSDEFTQLLRQKIHEVYTSFEGAKNALSEVNLERIIKANADVIAKIVDDQFAGFGDEELIRQSQIFAITYLRKMVFSPQSSGIVIAGFGDKEYFPKLVQYQTDGYIGTNVKIDLVKKSDISRQMESAIIPFAQKEMVQRFMNGIDPSYSRFLQRTFGASLYRNCLQILDTYGSEENKTDEVRNAIKNATIESLNSIRVSSKGFQQENFSDPIIDMISLLPKDELPNLAESLVALTSLKRHVSHDAETVGGPIDVALISKCDGFVWIKRKQYFREDLNPHFVRNYFREAMEENFDGGTARAIGRPNGAVAGSRRSDNRPRRSRKAPQPGSGDDQP